MTHEETLEALAGFDGVEVVATIQQADPETDPVALVAGRLEVVEGETPDARVRVGDNLIVLAADDFQSAEWVPEGDELPALLIESGGLQVTFAARGEEDLSRLL